MAEHNHPEPRRRIEAMVRPALLRWGRESSNYSLDRVAGRLKVKIDKLRAWEEGDLRPSIAQLRKLAAIYKRPLALFFLHDPPVEPDQRSFFRRLPASLTMPFSPELTHEIRAAEAKRDAALGLWPLGSTELPIFALRISRNDNVDEAAEKLRRFLGVSVEEQNSWRDAYQAFNSWRASLETVGVLVFQASGINIAEMRGLSVFNRQLPIILVNTKDSPKGRVFTLMHELAHLALGEGELTSSGLENAPDAIETFCNGVAGKLLVPGAALDAATALRSRAGASEMPPEELRNLSRRFWVSEMVVLRRLLDTKRVSLEAYRREAKRLEALPRPAAPKAFARKRHEVVLSAVGRLYAGTVIDALSNDRISASDASSFLNLKTKYLPALEDALGARAWREP